MSGQHTRQSFNVLDIGGGVAGRANLFYPGCNIVTLDKLTGFDVEKQELPRGDWDVIFCNHIIEHLVDVDEFLFKCWRVMDLRTTLEIATPNLLSWYNRIFCLMGYLPNSYEVSINNVGRFPLFAKEQMGGHIRLFTPKALVQLLRENTFKILSVVGECSTYKGPHPIMLLDKFMTLNPNLASAFRVKCTL